jgi:uncharacterized membrane protein YbhN (UPF0104 family)
MQIKSNSPEILNMVRQASLAVKQSIEETEDLTDEQKEKLKDAVDKTVIPAAEVPNTFVYWLAVGAIGLMALLIVIGGLYLASMTIETPNFLQMALATAIGALAGMVVPTPKSGL